MDKILIENFAGLKNATFEINEVNIYIGKQASGKSVTAKLIYYFNSLFEEIFRHLFDNIYKKDIDNKLIEKFEDYFPSDTWPEESFRISYKFGEDEFISVEKKGGRKPSINYSKKLKKFIFRSFRSTIKRSKREEENESKLTSFRFRYELEEKFFDGLNNSFSSNFVSSQIFVPAGRSFFAHLQSSIFTFLSKNEAIDPFLVEFGSYYENIKGFLDRNSDRYKKKSDYIDDQIKKIIGGEYFKGEKNEYIIHRDKRKINVSNTSSGQQETLPLALILKSMLLIRGMYGLIVYIEEPEAHLFPSAQREIVELIAYVVNESKGNRKIFITTHSPYILTSFNNLLQAGEIYSKSDDEKSVNTLEKQMPIKKNQTINPFKLNAYALKEKTAVSIKDKKTDLIKASYLDKVSEDIAIEFDEILDLI